MSDNFAEDSKPDASETITIKIRNERRNVFQDKKSTKMQKVFETYAGRKGVNSSVYRFLLDGERIQPTDTPKMLEMEDQDQINCVLAQSGGRGL